MPSTDTHMIGALREKIAAMEADEVRYRKLGAQEAADEAAEFAEIYRGALAAETGDAVLSIIPSPLARGAFTVQATYLDADGALIRSGVGRFPTQEEAEEYIREHATS